MRSAHLHTFRRDVPPRCLKVELSPPGANQLAGADEGVSHQLQPESGHLSSLINLYLAEQLWQLPSVDPSIVFPLSRSKNVAWFDFRGRISSAVSMSDGISEYLSGRFERPLGNVPSSTLIDQFDHRDYFRRFDLRDRSSPKDRQNIALQ